jgi:ATP-dependent helicase HrpA
MRLGVRRLLLLTVPSPARDVVARMRPADKLALARDTGGRAADAVRDAIAAAVDALVAEAGGPPADAAGFTALRERVATRLPGRTVEVVDAVAAVQAGGHELRELLAADPGEVLRPAYDDMRAQLDGLVSLDAATRLGVARLADVRRYLDAMRHRLDRLPRDPARDLALMDRVHAVEDAWHDALDRLPRSEPVPAELADVRWMLEELRVSLFAQQLGTAYPVSEKRILQVLYGR